MIFLSANLLLAFVVGTSSAGFVGGYGEEASASQTFDHGQGYRQGTELHSGGGHGPEIGASAGSYESGIGGGSTHGGDFETKHLEEHVSIPTHTIEHTKPVPVPVYKKIGVPVPHPVGVPVPQVIKVPVPQPYPVHVPVPQPIAVPIYKLVPQEIEKKVPITVHKIVPVEVEKPYKIEIEKHHLQYVEKPYPVHVPVYKHVYHHVPKHGGGGGGHGWH